VTGCQSGELLRRLRDEGFKVHVLNAIYPNPHDWAFTRRILTAASPAWVALDGYHFDEIYQRRVKEDGHRLLVIDDLAHLPYYDADVILNQNCLAAEQRYLCEPSTCLLLGTQYILLRREFLQEKGFEREIPKVARKVLVTPGGSDPEGITLSILHAMEQANIDGLEVKVVPGASNMQYEELQGLVKQLSFKVWLERDVNNMAVLMAWADMAVIAAGGTLWELLYKGTSIVSYARNALQEAILSVLARSGSVVYLGRTEQLDLSALAFGLRRLAFSREVRQTMSRSGQALVDGKGTSRTLEVLL
jgi:UDP-2,4-diacetamido-2,4,6-trideoxy-beta-L-altropyranose hydrolase